jgi:AraC-like DNA-binding protein
MIRQNMTDSQFCVKRLALMLNVSRSCLRKAVHKFFQTSPQKLIQGYRIAYAVQLLDQGVKIHIVSRSAGYGSDRAFRMAFRRQRGMAPIEHRKKRDG